MCRGDKEPVQLSAEHKFSNLTDGDYLAHRSLFLCIASDKYMCDLVSCSEQCEIISKPLSVVLLRAVQQLGEKVQGFFILYIFCRFGESLLLWNECFDPGGTGRGLILIKVKPRTTQINSNLLDLLGFS